MSARRLANTSNAAVLHIGAVTFIHRFGPSLNEHVHFSCVRRASATDETTAAHVQASLRCRIPRAFVGRGLLGARARDVIEHIERVVHHARRLEQSVETVVQIHFSAQGNRTNDIMRTLTAITAVFLPLNLITGFFVLVFWRKRYLARTRQ